MAMGVSSEDAAKMFSVASPAAPGQEGTAVQAAMRAIEQMKVAGKEGMFGVTNKMGPYESVKAFAANMAERKRTLMAGGKTEEEANIELAKVLKENDVASDVRERRGLIAGFGRMGEELGGFKTYEAVAVGREPILKRRAESVTSSRTKAARPRSTSPTPSRKRGWASETRCSRVAGKSPRSSYARPDGSSTSAWANEWAARSPAWSLALRVSEINRSTAR